MNIGEDNNIFHLAVGLGWLYTKNRLKEYTDAYSIEDVVKEFEKQLFLVLAPFPKNFLRNRYISLEEILNKNPEFQNMRKKLSSILDSWHKSHSLLVNSLFRYI